MESTAVADENGPAATRGGPAKAIDVPAYSCASSQRSASSAAAQPEPAAVTACR